jgi:DNA replication protein DnaC
MAATSQWANHLAQNQHNGHNQYNNRIQINGVNLANMAPRTNKVVDFGPYQLSDPYVDRAELSELKNRHNQMDRLGRKQQKLRLCGMAGTGKTQIAIKFATDSSSNGR